MDYDYLVYSACDNFIDEEAIWECDYLKLVKRMLFKKFDNWIDYSISEWYKGKHGG